MRPTGFEPANSGLHDLARLPFRHRRKRPFQGLRQCWGSNRLAQVAPVVENVSHDIGPFHDGYRPLVLLTPTGVFMRPFRTEPSLTSSLYD